MNFKAKTSLTLSAAALLFLCACGDDSSKSSAPDDTDITPTDSTTNNNTPGDNKTEVPSDSSATPADSSATPADSAATPADSNTTVDPSTLPAEGPITLPTGKGLLLDDFEDGDGESLTGNYWYTYSDADNSGASTIVPEPKKDFLPAAVNNGSNYAMKIVYTLDKGDYEYDPYVGWGVQIDEDDENAKYGGITYWYKGGAHEVHIEISDVKNYDQYLAKVKKATTWTQVTIRFKDLVQGWSQGKDAVPFNPAHITAVSFQAKGSGSTITTDSLYIDNIYLQDTSEVEKDKEDMSINDPVIPEISFTEAEITVTNPLQAKAMKYLNKGINFTNWLEDAKGKFKKFVFDEEDIKLMAESGIKSLRLPIDLDLYATNRDAFVKDSKDSVVLKFDDDTLFMVLDSFVEWTGKYGMSLVIDYHEYDNGYNATTAVNDKYIKMMAETWKHVAAHYAENTREDIFFELLNEPDMKYGAVKAETWTVAAQAMIDSIRSVDKTHTILFGDAEWYSIKLLTQRTPFTDNNIVYVIHNYEPFVFTHQGGSWTDYATIKNIPFPYDPAKWSKVSGDFGVVKGSPTSVKNAVRNYYKNGSKEAIMKQMLKAKKWAAENNVPVIINEFGALNLTSTAESRLNYLTAVREICDTLQIPWTHWGYTGGFSLFEGDLKGTKLIDGVAEAPKLGE
ncbi:cellulase family glycosylhydrolase [Fibrobacter sp.]|uniref:cellulase family glycosylhydrolase n=1 Tax=Fibrobacter sp. TaxID=35828 RepID=UPI003890107F